MEDSPTTQIIDLRQSPQYAKYMQAMGWQVIKIDHIQVFIKKIGFLGAIAKIQRVDLPIPWEKIQPILKKYRVWMTKLEPIKLGPIPQGFHQDKWPLLATRTQRIDLIKLLTLKKDARYCLRKVDSSQLTVDRNNFDTFFAIWEKANWIKKLWTPGKKHFDSLVKSFAKHCFCITVNNSAGALILVHGKVAYYYYAGSTPEAKKHYLPYYVVLELLKEAEKRGCKVWDWEGIYDIRWPNKSWQGFTHFKKSFGGYEVIFPGSFTQWSLL